MTLLDDRPDADEEVWRAADPVDDGREVAAASVHTVAPASAPEAPPWRTLVATLMSSVSAALMIGGIFDSWTCRLLGILGALAGTAAYALPLRSRRSALAHAVLPPVVAVLGSLTLLGAPGGPSNLPTLVRAAIRAGGLLHPPVPFDPGWRPVVFGIVAFIAYGSAWLGAGLRRPLLGLCGPLPVALLASFTQPPSGQAVAAVYLLLPLLVGVGVLYAAGGSHEQFDFAFEMRRALKALALAVPALGLLLAFNSANFLFPKPTYDPNDRPQKPRAVPLSSQVDRVLFEVVAPEGFTGPWRTGVLDVYDDGVFKLPAQTANRLQPIPERGVLDAANLGKATTAIRITTGDLGDSPIMPTVPTAARVTLPASAPTNIRLDTRTGVLRVASGRAPSGLTYQLDLPPYPTAAGLGAAKASRRSRALSDDFGAPAKMPVGAARVIRDAPPSGWARLDYIRHQLLDHVTAAGPGTPVPMDAKRVQDLLDGSKKGTPFEIVAAQVLLARWAGFPARIGYGFNEFHVEDGHKVIRPADAAQWLEVSFDGYGFIPLLDKPPKADTSLDNPNKPDAGVVASDDVAVELFFPVDLPHPVPLFEVVRARLLQALPTLLLLVLARAAAPELVRALRRRRREAYALENGPRARIAAAYAEVRDTATDLNVGDPFATPLEYLARVVPDPEHTELAWLVSRSMYGDLATTITDGDAAIAEELARSLRRRLRTGQPAQIRILGLLSQASLQSPYTDEVPNLRLPAPGRALGARRRAFADERARRRRQRHLRRETEARRFRLPALAFWRAR